MKILLFFLLLLLISCDINYKHNYQINKRRPPIVIIAIDTATNSVVMRDGDNQVFTIYDNATTKAISKSLSVGDTLRLEQTIVKIFNEKF